MTNTTYSKIANNILNKTSSAAVIRIQNSKILIEVLKLLKKPNDAYLNLLNNSYYNWLPDYFFTKPASSSGKYHPAFANKNNGLMLHSLAVVKLTDLLSKISDITDNNIYNDLICAAWLHDMFKYGDPDKNNSNTVFEHPKYAAEFFKNPDVIAKCISFGLNISDINLISDLISTHMGQYNTNKYSKIILNTPETDLQRLLSAADYLASRKENDIVADML